MTQDDAKWTSHLAGLLKLCILSVGVGFFRVGKALATGSPVGVHDLLDAVGLSCVVLVILLIVRAAFAKGGVGRGNA